MINVEAHTAHCLMASTIIMVVYSIYCTGRWAGKVDTVYSTAYRTRELPGRCNSSSIGHVEAGRQHVYSVGSRQSFVGRASRVTGWNEHSALAL